MREENVLMRARFDDVLMKYWMVSALFALTISFVGIPLVPVWLIFGWGFHRKQFERLECELTDRTLNIRRGVLFRVEKNIPLDKIQDLAMHEGPLLRRLGLCALSIETAGSGGGQGVPDAKLTGVIDAPAFRDAVLNQRDTFVTPSSGFRAPPPMPDGSGVSGGAGAANDVLVEIRDSLQRIERLLAEHAADESANA